MKKRIFKPKNLRYISIILLLLTLLVTVIKNDTYSYELVSNSIIF